MRYVALLHLLAALAVWVCALPLLARLVGLCLIAASHWCQMRRLSRLGGFLCFGEERGWWLERNGCPPETLAIRGSSVVTPWIVVVQARGHRAEHAWALVAGAGDRDSFRHLRVCLRVDRSSGNPSSGQREAASPQGSSSS
ncbi:protein YgfX [Methylolobus aquaticus]